jgi:succinate-acetate transporter protein
MPSWGPGTTAALASVSASASTVVLRAANPARVGLLVYNDSTAVLYLAYAAAASTSVYSVQIPGGGYYEMPYGGQFPYAGAVSGIWASANGAARITELTEP